MSRSMITQNSVCLVCGSSQWADLPDPHPSRSVTTASRLLPIPLGKSQCMSCGAAQRVRVPMLSFTDYYETDYANYYERPGTELFHKQRYSLIWDWICTSTTIGGPKRVLDVGCGQGWLMDLIRETFPDAVIEGVEPSSHNVEVARKKGHHVHEGRLDDVRSTLNPFDLVVSTNVLQHVSDPRDFLDSLSNLASESGLIVVTCPDGGRPNIELLWADQNLSITYESLHRLAISSLPASREIKIIQSEGKSAALPPALLLAAQVGGRSTEVEFDESLESLFKKRVGYLNSFRLIDDFLSDQSEGCSCVVNLGASYWSSVLAAYCPKYWSRVSRCCVDDPKGQTEFFGKYVIETSEVSSNSCVVLGVAPSAQNNAAKMFSGKYKRVVCWWPFLSFPF